MDPTEDDRDGSELLNAYVREIAAALESMSLLCRGRTIEAGAAGKPLGAELVIAQRERDRAHDVTWSEETGWSVAGSPGSGEGGRVHLGTALAPAVADAAAWLRAVLVDEEQTASRPRRFRERNQRGLREQLLAVAPPARMSRCGTGYGWQTHVDLGEEPCARCAAAFAELVDAGVVPLPTGD